MQPCLKYCMHYINLLRFNDITPVIVFDGGHLPSKASTEDERKRRRDLSRQQAMLKLSEGDANGAQELFQRAVEITPLMAYELIKILKEEGLEFVVAPYEADAQLAYLSMLSQEKGGVAAVISEDSDLLAYGCSVVIYKMDRHGHGEEVRIKDIMNMNSRPEGSSKSLWFGCFTFELFTGMCVLAGCDFLPSVPGIGIKRAHGLVSKYRDLRRVLSSVRFERKELVPEGYELAFKQANVIFRHARIYDGSARKLSFLNPLPPGLVEEFNGELDFLGPDLPTSQARSIAEGQLDPVAKCFFSDVTRVDRSRMLLQFGRIEHGGSQDANMSSTGGITEREPVYHNSNPSICRKEDFCDVSDDELLRSLATVESTPSIISAPVNPTGSSVSYQKDNGFLAHLSFLSRNLSSNQSSLEGEDYSVDTKVVSLSPKKKRVIPPHPMNPFKRLQISLDGEKVASCPLNRKIFGHHFCNKECTPDKSATQPGCMNVLEFTRLNCASDKPVWHETLKSTSSHSDEIRMLEQFQQGCSFELLPPHSQTREDLDKDLSAFCQLKGSGMGTETQVSAKSSLMPCDSAEIESAYTSSGVSTTHWKQSLGIDVTVATLRGSLESEVQKPEVKNLEQGSVSEVCEDLSPFGTHKAFSMDSFLSSGKSPNLSDFSKQQSTETKTSKCNKRRNQSCKGLASSSAPDLFKFFKRASGPR
ncbi:hypothetical protein KP509_01G025500 [Ceratopteris richardii]|nr:hypothetical protein KP509_01G025500 [Ceratopteris richardii]